MIQIIILYILLALLCYVLFYKGYFNITFYTKDTNEKVDLNENDKQIMFIFMSIFWIYFLPKLYFGRKKK